MPMTHYPESGTVFSYQILEHVSWALATNVDNIFEMGNRRTWTIVIHFCLVCPASFCGRSSLFKTQQHDVSKDATTSPQCCVISYLSHDELSSRLPVLCATPLYLAADIKLIRNCSCQDIFSACYRTCFIQCKKCKHGYSSL